MRISMSPVISLVLAGVFAAVGTAQQATERKTMDKKDEMKKAFPKPAPEIDKLKLFMGTWTTVEKHEPSKWSAGGDGKGSSVVEFGPGGFSVVEDYKSTMPMGAFAGHGVTVWDAGEQAYKLYWFDSMIPVVLEQSCRWKGSDFVCLGEMTIEGNKIKSKTTTTAITPNSRTLIYESSGGNGPLTKMMTISYVKE